LIEEAADKAVAKEKARMEKEARDKKSAEI